MIAYFMGVWPGDSAGHYCVLPNGDSTGIGGREHPPSPWAEASYMPLGDSTATKGGWPERHDRQGMVRYDWEQPEGRARVVRRDGWTLVTMWDRSADGRRGSHASFALHADLEPQAALQQARSLFPAVFARIERHLGRSVVLDEGSAVQEAHP